MNALPMFMTVRGQPVIVVGAGEAAAAKARLASKAGALVSVYGFQPVDAMRDLEASGHVVITPGLPDAEVLRTAKVVYVATENPESDRVMAMHVRRVGVPVNVVDRPELCDFTTPAVVNRDPVLIAIGTEGASPVLARRLRATIERLLPSRLGGLARLAAQFRETVGQMVPARDRRRFWEAFMDGAPAQAALAGNETAARGAAMRLIDRMTQTTRDEAMSPSIDGTGSADGSWDAQADDAHIGGFGRGIVHLVGAGPGDPDLLTMKAHRLLQAADVVVHDDLVGPDILDLARKDAERIDVGKRAGRHRATQEQINGILLHHARDGQVVVRLKGGDPSIFARAGEEIAYLRAHDIPVRMTPGVTAASAVAAAAGISLTERGVASSVTLVTGRLGDDVVSAGPEGQQPDWATLARTGGTLAIYMGRNRAEGIAERLMASGLSPETSVAVVGNAAREDQQLRHGVLSGLGALAADVMTPALLLVGDVTRAAAGSPAEGYTIAAPEALPGTPSLDDVLTRQFGGEIDPWSAAFPMPFAPMPLRRDLQGTETALDVEKRA